MSALLRRQLEIVAGFALWTLSAFALFALATWNVADPSWSFATDAPVGNAMGYPGAVFADLMMQFFGIAALPALVPLVFWGHARIRGHYWPHALRRLAVWPLAAVLTAAAIGCLPVTAHWPLPTGLGGVLGDMVLRLPGMLSGGYPEGWVRLLAFLVAMPAAFYAMAVSCGFMWHETEESDAGDDDEEAGGRFVTLGAVIHGLYTLRSALRRAVFGSRRRPSASRRRIVAEEPGSRVEPEFAGEDMPDAVEDDYRDDDDDWAPQPVRGAEPDAAASPVRVAPAAPKPKPSVRVQREAQTSFLPDGGFELPPIHLLAEPKNVARDASLSAEALEANARVLEGVLEDFGVRGEIIQVRPGPVVTLYELEPAPGIKSSRVIGLAEDIARSMSAVAARVAVVPGRNAIGIELPNARRETVFLRELISSQAYDSSKAKLALTLGKTINGEAVIADLAKMPHLLVAGTTGSGKSVAINTMILSILYKMTPEECRLIMIDPKMLELSVYDGIPHLLTPVVTDPKKAVVALKWTVREMEQRYKNMSKIGVRNIDGFNAKVREAAKKGKPITRTVQTGFDRETGEAIYETETLDLEPMPYIIVIIDEMADLMMVAGKDIEGAVQRLAQMARAAGIHVIMATQRPSVDVITGTIKANFPTRISFQVTSKIDSRTILGEQGAEQLLGMGDMLYMAGGGRIQRVHGPFVSDREVEEIVAHLKTQGVPEYLESVTEEDEEDAAASGAAGGMGESDDPYDQAVAIVLRDKKASTSYIQRRLGIGYNRAASLIERMEEEGIIGPANHAGKREILVPTEDDEV
ncbi:DNA translocase FtsK [Oricola thermophila]|uniref:DNA translocase FtsK n=1 Tax=Oricola thermophila TaxID=2742145 RepID=A0A6N1VLQ1_9HYPH|nr:DNA translocase FtsK [Oricola thermophila]QKV19877.1 DNA translocase FtsK [Oricola thermophila]